MAKINVNLEAFYGYSCGCHGHGSKESIEKEAVEGEWMAREETSLFLAPVSIPAATGRCVAHLQMPLVTPAPAMVFSEGPALVAVAPLSVCTSVPPRSDLSTNH